MSESASVTQVTPEDWILSQHTKENRDKVNGYSTYRPPRNSWHPNVCAVSSMEYLHRTQNPTTESVGAQKNKSLPSTEVPPASETFASPASDDVGVLPASSAIDDDSIVVRTPSVDITIALTGGDITQILLKDYPVSLKNPDQPIALLDDASRTYIAQSGLVGPDGPDAFQSGRPLYKASQQQYVVNEPTDISIKTETDTGLIITKTFCYCSRSL